MGLGTKLSIKTAVFPRKRLKRLLGPFKSVAEPLKTFACSRTFSATSVRGAALQLGEAASRLQPGVGAVKSIKRIKRGDTNKIMTIINNKMSQMGQIWAGSAVALCKDGHRALGYEAGDVLEQLGARALGGVGEQREEGAPHGRID